MIFAAKTSEFSLFITRYTYFLRVFAKCRKKYVREMPRADFLNDFVIRVKIVRNAIKSEDLQQFMVNFLVFHVELVSFTEFLQSENQNSHFPLFIVEIVRRKSHVREKIVETFGFFQVFLLFLNKIKVFLTKIPRNTPVFGRLS